MEYFLAMDSMVEIDDKFWFYSFIDDCICRMDKKTFDTEIIVELPIIEGHIETKPRYGKIFEYKRKLYLVPMLMISILVYDIDSGQITYIEYSKKEFLGTVFSDAVMIDSALYLIPCDYNSIVCVDLDTETVGLYETKDNNIMAWGNVLEDNGRLLFGCIDEGVIYEFNIKNNQLKTHFCDKAPSGVSGIWKYNGNYFIIPRVVDRIIISNDDLNDFNEIIFYMKDYKPGEWSIYKSVVIDNIIYMLPRMANKVLVFNMETNKYNTFDFLEKISPQKRNWLDYMPISHIWKQDGNIICVYSKSGQFYDACTSEHIEINVNKKTGKRFIAENGIIEEGVAYLSSLKHYLEFISYDN